MKIAIYPGSFDPITLGHLDIIRRAAACFDRVCVCVSPNAEKRNQMFTPEQKLQLVRTAVADLPNVEAELWPGLLADFAVRHHASAIVRGVRNTTDFEYERTMAATNRRLYPAVVTVMLFTPPDVADISSSTVREVLAFGRSVAEFLPRGIELENYL